MATFFGIDPAKVGFAWAKVEDGRLTACEFCTWGDLSEFGKMLSRSAWRNSILVCIERPQVYRQSKWKGDPNDLLDVAMTVGAIRHEVVFYRDLPFRSVAPHDWKGSTPKKISQARIVAALTGDELKILEQPELKRHLSDILDAVGIARFAAGK